MAPRSPGPAEGQARPGPPRHALQHVGRGREPPQARPRRRGPADHRRVPRTARPRPIAPPTSPAWRTCRLEHFAKARDAEGCRATAELWEAMGTHRPRQPVQRRPLPGRHRRGPPREGPDARRDERADAEAERAMEWLRRAVAAGFRDADGLRKRTGLRRPARSRRLPRADREAGGEAEVIRRGVVPSGATQPARRMAVRSPGRPGGASRSPIAVPCAARSRDRSRSPGRFAVRFISSEVHHVDFRRRRAMKAYRRPRAAGARGARGRA